MPDGEESQPGANTIDEADALTRQFELDSVFRPGAPIDRADLFFGRGPERWSVLEAIRSPGQHAVIFGERGVGKTSLAKTCIGLSLADGVIALRVGCDGGDDFYGLWQKFVDECAIYLASTDDPPPQLEVAIERATEVLMSNDIGPGQVRIALRHIVRHVPVVVYFDEFDQVRDSDALDLMSNTIKLLSDQVEPVTIIPVGVAETLDDLIRGHQSIGRIVTQVRMPRMSRSELAQIAQRGLAQLEMTAEPLALNFIATVPRGLPQYAHLIAQEGARQALMAHTTRLTTNHLLEGLRVGLSKVDHTVSSAYDTATYSAKKARFKEVLLACALCNPDEHGYFSPADLREPYSRIIGEQVDVDRFNPQLVALAEGRGQILHRVGEKGRRRYRFSDPLMEPYVLLRGLDAETVNPWEVVGMEPLPDPPNASGRLFEP